jgi:hypothetical protein
MSSEIHDRRTFLEAMAVMGAMATTGLTSSGMTSGSSSTRWPLLKGSPVLDSLHPVIEHSRDVRTNVDKMVEVAGWMGYEELPMPDYEMPFDLGRGNSDELIDFVLTADCVDTAFTDFSSHVKFQVDYAGRHWSDSDALFACMKRALDNGIPILDGRYLAQLTRPQMERSLPLTSRSQCWRRKWKSGGRWARCWRRNTMAAFTISPNPAHLVFTTMAPA